MWAGGQTTYAAAFTGTVRGLITGRDIDVEVRVTRIDGAMPEVVIGYDDLAAELDEIARRTTHWPMVGSEPDWTSETAVGQLRAAELTCLDRSRQR